MPTIELKGANFIVVYIAHCYYVIRPLGTQLQAVYISILWQTNIWVLCGFVVSTVYILGPDYMYMSRAGLFSRAASVCRDDFQTSIT